MCLLQPCGHGASYRLLLGLGDPRWRAYVSVALALEYEEAIGRESDNTWMTPQEAGEVLDFVLSTDIQQAILNRPKTPLGASHCQRPHCG